MLDSKKLFFENKRLKNKKLNLFDEKISKKYDYYGKKKTLEEKKLIEQEDFDSNNAYFSKKLERLEKEKEFDNNEISDLKKKIKKANSQIIENEKMLKDQEIKITHLENDLERNKYESADTINNYKILVNELNDKISKLQEKLKKYDEKNNKNESKIEELKKHEFENKVLKKTLEDLKTEKFDSKVNYKKKQEIFEYIIKNYSEEKISPNKIRDNYDNKNNKSNTKIAEDILKNIDNIYIKQRKKSRILKDIKDLIQENYDGQDLENERILLINEIKQFSAKERDNMIKMINLLITDFKFLIEIKENMEKNRDEEEKMLEEMKKINQNTPGKTLQSLTEKNLVEKEQLINEMNTLLVENVKQENFIKIILKKIDELEDTSNAESKQDKLIKEINYIFDKKKEENQYKQDLIDKINSLKAKNDSLSIKDDKEISSLLKKIEQLEDNSNKNNSIKKNLFDDLNKLKADDQIRQKKKNELMNQIDKLQEIKIKNDKKCREILERLKFLIINQKESINNPIINKIPNSDLKNRINVFFNNQDKSYKDLLEKIEQQENSSFFSKEKDNIFSPKLSDDEKKPNEPNTDRKEPKFKIFDNMKNFLTTENDRLFTEELEQKKKDLIDIEEHSPLNPQLLNFSSNNDYDIENDKRIIIKIKYMILKQKEEFFINEKKNANKDRINLIFVDYKGKEELLEAIKDLIDNYLKEENSIEEEEKINQGSEIIEKMTASKINRIKPKKKKKKKSKKKILEEEGDFSFEDYEENKQDKKQEEDKIPYPSKREKKNYVDEDKFESMNEIEDKKTPRNKYIDSNNQFHTPNDSFIEENDNENTSSLSEIYNNKKPVLPPQIIEKRPKIEGYEKKPVIRKEIIREYEKETVELKTVKIIKIIEKICEENKEESYNHRDINNNLDLLNEKLIEKDIFNNKLIEIIRKLNEENKNDKNDIVNLKKEILEGKNEGKNIKDLITIIVKTLKEDNNKCDEIYDQLKVLEKNNEIRDKNYEDLLKELEEIKKEENYNDKFNKRLINLSEKIIVNKKRFKTIVKETEEIEEIVEIKKIHNKKIITKIEEEIIPLIKKDSKKELIDSLKKLPKLEKKDEKIKINDLKKRLSAFEDEKNKNNKEILKEVERILPEIRKNENIIHIKHTLESEERKITTKQENISPEKNLKLKQDEINKLKNDLKKKDILEKELEDINKNLLDKLEDLEDKLKDLKKDNNNTISEDEIVSKAEKNKNSPYKDLYQMFLLSMGKKLIIFLNEINSKEDFELYENILTMISYNNYPSLIIHNLINCNTVKKVNDYLNSNIIPKNSRKLTKDFKFLPGVYINNIPKLYHAVLSPVNSEAGNKYNQNTYNFIMKKFLNENNEEITNGDNKNPIEKINGKNNKISYEIRSNNKCFILRIFIAGLREDCINQDNSYVEFFINNSKTAISIKILLDLKKKFKRNLEIEKNFPRIVELSVLLATPQ